MVVNMAKVFVIANFYFNHIFIMVEWSSKKIVKIKTLF